ncbi:NAD(P)/FAD-dependent oxidoreductase [Mycobacterium sp. 94-17]|uniref:flavin-containing monooxygenase n=1 Tax=Mycobacterium sp. 94-17 TaxID=2986147 RepID=UPI002D1EFEC4|nr:NAD(P)/FAD-dependent oxidoreductase [Mycobacterium sp. 94-17]MEB4209755.1 NAD(P)/FAD-dependent oxidoreductase [Mycobacterium sp. 94-17]
MTSLGADLIQAMQAADIDVAGLRQKYRQERDKRFNARGLTQFVQVSAEFSGGVDDPYTDPDFTRPSMHDEVDAVIVGAGFSGLLIGTRLRALGLARIRLIEHAGDVGGVWYWNRYPGAMCDVESYTYIPMLEELGYIPKHKYSSAVEIFEHAQRIARAYRLYDDALFSTEVRSASWHDESKRWTVRTDRGDSITTQFLVLASGPLTVPKLPALPGINEFSGHTFHTSRWDYGYTGGDITGNLTGLSDKRVGVVGTGATAIQCVPKLAESAKHLYVFQRTPAIVGVRGNRETDPSWAATLTPGWQRRRLENFTTLVSGGYQDVDLVDDAWTDLFPSVTPLAARRMSERLGRPLERAEMAEFLELCDYQKADELRARVASIVRDPVTAEALKFWYRIFCKRPCFHDEYLQSFNRPNVTLVDTDGRGIDRFTAHGVLAGDHQIDLDCLIFATGFEIGTAFWERAHFDLAGRGGVRLSERWAKGPRTFFGMQSHGFPNCFFMGAMQAGATVCVTHVATEQADHVAAVIALTLDHGGVVDVTRAGEDSWQDEMREKAPSNAFEAECTPSYFNSEGDANNPNGIPANRYGGGALKYFEILRQWRASGEAEGLAFESAAR